MSYEKELGERIRNLREKRNLSLRELGSALDMDYSYLGRIERGFVPSTKALTKIAEYFDVNLSYLLGDKIEIPIELKPYIKEWFSFIDEQRRKGYTPEELREIVEFMEKFKNNHKNN